MKTLEEMIKGFSSMCKQQSCENCKYGEARKTMGECGVAYAFEQLVGARPDSVGSEPPKHATAYKMESVQLPKWCKEGQWVFHNGCLLGKIEGFEAVDEVDRTPPTTYVVLRSYDTSNKLPFTRLPKQIQPVRFREYSFEEAKGLLGKVMDYSCDNGPFSGRSEKSTLITDVSNGKCGVLINGDLFTTLSELFNATIDGIPIGVPEVDKEAMRGGKE